jgi:hypothetical protein
MIHDRICESEKVNKVSLGAEILWERLLTRVDDNGNYDGDPLVVYANCLRYKSGVTVKDVEKWIKELLDVRSDDDKGLLVQYTFKGRKYLHIVKFRKYQDLRDDKTRTVQYPPHPTEIGEPAYLKTGRGLDVIRTETVSGPSADRLEPVCEAPKDGLEVEVEAEEEDEVEAAEQQQQPFEEVQQDNGDWAAFIKVFRSAAGGSTQFSHFRSNQEKYEELCRRYGRELVNLVIADWVALKGGKEATKKNQYACKNFLEDADGLIEDRKAEKENPAPKPAHFRRWRRIRYEHRH